MSPPWQEVSRRGSVVLAQGYLDYVSFGQEIETEWIEITITDARAGTKYEDTCISELVVY